MHKIALTLTAAILSIPAGYSSELMDTVHLEGAYVSSPRKTDIQLSPLSVTIVDASAIDKSTESSLLPVLQDAVPGLFVSERGFAGYGVSGGAAGSVSIRGVGQGNKVLFMIDGMPQWAGVFGHALPDTYVANGVERVEVVKGPSSLLYGSNAMGGSVNIITKKATTDGLSGRARALFGSFSTQKFNTAVSYRQGRLGVTAAGQVDRSNGNRAGSEFWLANEYVQADYSASRNWQTGVTLDMSQTRADNPGTMQSPLESMWTRLTRGTAAVYVNNRYERSKGGAQVYVNWGSNRVDDGHAPGAEPRDYIFRSTDYNAGFTLFQNIVPWSGNDLSIGVDFVHWGGHVWNVKKESGQKTDDFSAHLNEVAGYVIMQQGLFDDILALNAGVRLQHSSQYGNEWVPQAGLILKPFKGSSLKFSYGKGFRAPNLRELYLYAPANPDLKPEYLNNFEVELRQRALDNRLNVGVALYYVKGKDMIQVQRVDGRPRNMNIGRFTNKGFEVDASFAVDERLRFTGNYSYLHTDADVLYAPKNKMMLRASYTTGAWELAVEEHSIWGLLTGGPEKSDYTLLNLRAAYTLGQRGNVPVTLLLKADNLTDKHYEIQYGCPMPGFTLMGGVEFKF